MAFCSFLAQARGVPATMRTGRASRAASGRLLLLLLPALVQGQCPCLEWPGLDNNLGTRGDGTLYLEVRPQGRNGPVFEYPANYAKFVFLISV